MAINSRDKGKRFERTLAGMLRAQGYPCRRGQQYSGASGDADVVGLPGIHIEAKAVERLNLYDAMAQARRDARADELPAVMHKRNHCAVLVTMELDDWARLYRAWETERGEER